MSKIIKAVNTNKPFSNCQNPLQPKKLQDICAKKILQPKVRNEFSNKDFINMAEKINSFYPHIFKKTLSDVAPEVVRESILETAKKRVQKGEHYSMVAKDLGIYKKKALNELMLDLMLTRRTYSSQPFQPSPQPSLKNIDMNDFNSYQELLEIYKERALNNVDSHSDTPDNSHIHTPSSILDSFLDSRAESFDTQSRRLMDPILKAHLKEKLRLDLDMEFLSLT